MKILDEIICSARLVGIMGNDNRFLLKKCLDTRLHVDAQDIKWKTSRKQPGTNKFRDVGRRIDGDWDIESTVLVEEHARSMGLYPDIYRFLDNEIKFSEITAYTNAVNSTGRKWRSTRDSQKLESYCESLRKMYEEMSTTGYIQRQDEISRTLIVRYRLTEILVDISRDGELLFVDGIHRYLIAKKLKLPVVCQPVVVHPGFDLDKLSSL